MKIKVVKKADNDIEYAPLSAFQIGQAKVKSRNAIKQLEFYSDAVSDEDFQEFLGEKLKGLCRKLHLTV